MADSQELPEHLRKQIEDALAEGHVERLRGDPPPLPRPRRRAPRLPDWRPRTPKDLLLAGALLALVAWMFPIFPLFRREALYLGFILIAIALVSFLLRPQGRSQHYWRGRPVELPPESWTDRLYWLLYRG